VRTSYRPQSNEQRHNEFDVICNEQRTQEIRVGRSYSTTLATISPFEYTGVIFCPTTSTGCFVARRNGKAFITGNSGFPKSHNISKAIDKMGGESLDWFIDYILEVAEERGISKKELTMLFPSKNGNPTGWLWNKQNNQSITLQQYNKIKDYLQLPFDNIEEVEREVIGKGKAGLTKGDIANFSGETEFNITAPSTDQAKQWDGWGSALKPAHEDLVLARKPFQFSSDFVYLYENIVYNLKLQLCQSKLFAKDVKEIFTLSQKEFQSNDKEIKLSEIESSQNIIQARQIQKEKDLILREQGIDGHITFVPKSSTTYNWMTYLSYPYSSNTTQVMSYTSEKYGITNSNFVVSDGIPFVIDTGKYNGKNLVYFYCATNHNLSVGEYVEIKLPQQPNGIGGKYVFQVFSIGDGGYDTTRNVFSIYDLKFPTADIQTGTYGNFKRIKKFLILFVFMDVTIILVLLLLLLSCILLNFEFFLLNVFYLF
jgi:hypothetical protein